MVSNGSKYYGDQTLFLTIFSYVFLEDFEMFLVCIAPFIMTLKCFWCKPRECAKTFDT